MKVNVVQNKFIVWPKTTVIEVWNKELTAEFSFLVDYPFKQAPGNHIAAHAND